MKPPKLKAVKAWANQTIHGYWNASPSQPGGTACYIVNAKLIDKLWRESEDTCSCAGCKLARACLGKKGAK